MSWRDEKRKVSMIMKETIVLKKEMKKVTIILLSVIALFFTFSLKTNAAEKQGTSIEKRETDSVDSREKKQKEEYKKWEIKNVNGIYYYKQKKIYMLVDVDGELNETNNFYYNKKGKICIEIARNEDGKIKDIKKFTKKKAKQIMDHFNNGYVFEKNSSK